MVKEKVEDFIGLHQEGPLVQYLPMSQVQAAVEVWYSHVYWYKNMLYVCWTRVPITYINAITVP